MIYIFKVHENLYLGGYWPDFNLQKLKEIGITAIVNLMEENLYDPRSHGFFYKYKGFPDDWYVPHEYLDEILEFIDTHVELGKVLVHCARGISRSGGVIIAWLMKKYPHWTWRDAHEFVNQSRLVFPSIEIKESILEYFEAREGKRRE
ncbi:MAG: dual specificity protein phosphatase family protein [Promethearchaeota archaeon]